jgi:hypothetical protein
MASRWEPNRPEIQKTVAELAGKEVWAVAKEIKDLSTQALIPHVDSGATIRGVTASRPAIRVGDVYSTVGTPTLAGYLLEKGTRRHTIRAAPGRLLTFWWEKTGRQEWFKSVNHPGMKAVPWLTGPARIVAAKHEFRWTKIDG